MFAIFKVLRGSGRKHKVSPEYTTPNAARVFLKKAKKANPEEKFIVQQKIKSEDQGRAVWKLLHR